MTPVHIALLLNGSPNCQNIDVEQYFGSHLHARHDSSSGVAVNSPFVGRIIALVAKVYSRITFSHVVLPFRITTCLVIAEWTFFKDSPLVVLVFVISLLRERKNVTVCLPLDIIT